MKKLTMKRVCIFAQALERQFGFRIGDGHRRRDDGLAYTSGSAGGNFVMIGRRAVSRGALSLAAVGLAGCSIPERGPAVPVADTDRALPFGIANTRYFADGEVKGMEVEGLRSIEREMALRRAAGQPAKGGRPSKQDAQVADESRATVRTEPKLTQKIISQWALTNARMETVAKPVKAPRFVSPTLRIQPTAVYTNGFTTKTASIDAERFSGSAVNFMAVKKFDTVR